MRKKIKYPVLLSLIVIQISALILCISLGLFVYIIVSKANISSAISALKEEIKPQLMTRQEQWRAWKMLGLDDAITSETNAIRQKYLLNKLEVLPIEVAKSLRDENRIIIPEKFDSMDGDYVVYAAIDSSHIGDYYKLNQATLFFLGLFVVMFVCIIIFSSWYIQDKIYRPILTLSRGLVMKKINGDINIRKIEASGEIKDFLNFVDQIYLKTKDAEKQNAIIEVNQQVAHDIRSPLAALEMILSDLYKLPEDKRVILRSAVTRIKDIANDLVQRHDGVSLNSELDKQKDLDEETAPHLIPALLETLMSEKRLQFRSKIGIEIILKMDSSAYGLFANINAREFGRVISNLINNGIEALGDDNQGRVEVVLYGDQSNIYIDIRDNGEGIPREVIPNLMRRGETRGKEGGLGLGLFHAKHNIEKWHGSISIDSSVGVGTTLKISIPSDIAPNWFVPEIVISEDSRIIIIDDDSSIHQVWQSRFDSFGHEALKAQIIHLSMPRDAEDWFLKNEKLNAQTIVLCDYEFLGASLNGLALIEKLDIAQNSILVTSRYEEVLVRNHCKRLGVKIISKGMVGLVPIKFAIPESSALNIKMEAVLIDDDALIRAIWEYEAKKRGINFQSFADVKSFMEASSNYNRDVPIYVDSNLKDEVKGEVVSREIAVAGFKDIFLATGFDVSYFSSLPPWIKGVHGKRPPWLIRE